MRRFIDVPDRLPFEVIDRLTSGSPRQLPDPHLRPVMTVMATKGSGTVRPFVRLSPRDLLLYQALVDAIAPDLEEALGSRERVFAYRLDTSGADDPFAGSPQWDDFMTSVRNTLKAGKFTHVLTGDVASYFVYVDVDELERRLLAVCSNDAAVRDLGELLRTWQYLGVRGLPQGVPPSSPLGNFYLSPLDRMLEAAKVEHRRYMDDFWVFASSFTEARQIQDSVEQLLYHDRLALGGEKSKIRRVSTALAATETASERINARRSEIAEEMLSQFVGEYGEPDEVELPEEEIDTAAIHSEYDDMLGELRADRYPQDVRPTLTALYRSLEKGRDPYAIEDVPEILLRMPDLTWPAVRYVSSARAEDADVAERVFLDLVDEHRFHREQEWLNICRAGLLLRRRPSLLVAARFGSIALSHPHPLVRARALLAWGRLSSKTEFDIADSYWRATNQMWQPYVLISIQQKQIAGRDRRYRDWSGDGRYLRKLATAIQVRPFPWKEL